MPENYDCLKIIMGQFIINNLLDFVIILILGLLIYKYLPTYFREKGKNLATKEDIGEITEKIEEVKSEFDKEREILKANLQVLSSSKESLISEERNALLEYIDKLFCWYTMSIDVQFGGINWMNVNEIDLYLAKLQNAYFQTLTACEKMEIFIDNNEILKLSREKHKEVYDKLFKFQLDCLNNLKVLVIQFNQSAIPGEKDGIQKEMLSQFKKLSEKIMQNIEQFYIDNIKFKKLIKEHLYKLVKEPTLQKNHKD